MFKLKRLLLEVKWPPSCGIGGHHAVESLAIFLWNMQPLKTGPIRAIIGWPD
jgi:hypothetical protein